MTGSHRRRRRDAAAVALIAVTAMVLAACQSSDPDPATTPPPSAPATESPAPSPSPSPSEATWPPTELDALTPADPVDEGEPTAYAAPEWLWDWVDDSWSTAIYSTLEFTHPEGKSPGFEGVQWLYLLAPDGAAFRIADLGDAANATIVDWDPGHRKAWLRLQGFSEERDVAEVDLLTGAVDTDDFTDGAGPRHSVEDESLALDFLPRAVAPDGTRLWVDIDPLLGATSGVAWYSPVTGEWESSAVNETLFDIAAARYARGTDGAVSPGYVAGSAWVSIADERALVMVPHEGGQGTIARTHIVIAHDLGDDSFTRTVFAALDATSSCRPLGPNGDSILVECSSVDGTRWEVEPAAGSVAEVSEDVVSDGGTDLGSYTEDVKAQGTRPPNVDDWTDLMPAPQVP
ncbi:hypothetical protein [Demequina aestuarii]|uniref:hypothetical protein n=1 Tax=Demequina aestuarii TaxID=327095 RepID=UPI00128C18AA|nr:hypothetical protein [Demequina aestuarii]